MDESLYRGFDERAQIFFTSLMTGIDPTSPPRALLKKRFIDEVKRVLTLSRDDTDRLRESFNLAFWAYRKTAPRSSGEAYVFHVVRGALVIAWVLSKHQLTDLALIHSFLLHDSYEETEDTWYSQLLVRSAVRFGPGSDIATDVYFLTKEDNESDESYFLRLLSCRRWRVLMVKFVDRIDNLWTIDAVSPDRRTRKIRETEVWFPQLAHELTSLITQEFEAGKSLKSGL